MARKLKVTPMTVYRWRNSEDMALSRVMQLANYFNLTVDQFLSWEEGNESGNSNLESYVEETDHGA